MVLLADWLAGMSDQHPLSLTFVQSLLKKWGWRKPRPDQANFFFGRTSDLNFFSYFVNLPFPVFYGQQHCL